MYKELAAKGKLSANDAKPLSFDQHCLGNKQSPPHFHALTVSKKQILTTHRLPRPFFRALVGVSEPLDPKDHEMLRRDTCDFEIVLPKTDPFYVCYYFLYLKEESEHCDADRTMPFILALFAIGHLHAFARQPRLVGCYS